jgi:hypothetical protein
MQFISLDLKFNITSIVLKILEITKTEMKETSKSQKILQHYEIFYYVVFYLRSQIYYY